MPENTRRNGYLDQIGGEFGEREVTPRSLMKLSIQLHLAGLSLSNTVSILDTFGVERARSTVHNGVDKAELQPRSGQNPDHVAADETVIRLNDEQYWLYAAVGPETNEVLFTKLEQTTNNAIAHVFFAEFREKHDVHKSRALVQPIRNASRF